MIARAVWIVFLVAWSMPARADVRAYVDRTVIADNETVELTIESTEAFDEPPLDAIQMSFDVLSTSRGSHVQIVRGKIESRQNLVLTLAPRQVGEIRIPALKIGDEYSAPITLKVVAAANEPKSARADLVVELGAEPRQAVVQEQVILTIKLFHAVDLREGKLTIPNLPDALVERLGEDETSEELRNGRRYKVVTRRLAVFPQKSGVLRIPPVEFNGQAVTRAGPSGSSFFNRPFGADPFDALFGQTKPVRARSSEISINIAPKPPDARGPWWLPAQAVTVSEAWSPSGPFRVGEPVTRTITLEAAGLTPAQLPELPLDAPAGVKHYSDQPSKDMRTSVSGVKSVKTQKVAYIATQPGTVTLPPIDIAWWNTVTRQVEHARLPARDMVFAPADTVASPTTVVPAPVVAPPADDQSAVSPVPATAPSASSETGTVWRIVAIAVFIGWIATLLVWWRHATRRRAGSNDAAAPSSEIPQKRSAVLSAVRDACKCNDAARLRDALLAFGAIRWPDAPPKSLGDAAQRVQDAAARDALWSIERRVYKSVDGEPTLDALSELLEKWIASEREPRAAKNHVEGLKPLYPEG